MKHLKNDFSQATFQPAQRLEGLDPILHQVEIPLNGLERLAVKVVESHGRPVLVIERQKTDRAGEIWRPITSAFRVSFARAPEICAAIGRLMRLVSDG